MSTRIESDSLGEVEVPADVLYGAQTVRAGKHFTIGSRGLPESFVRHYVRLKRCAADANQQCGVLDERRAGLIREACDALLESANLAAQFPLSVYHSGSGTQFNMNVNEVIANRANLLAGEALGSYAAVHPNDHVNRSQSTNDTFPTVMHVSASVALQEHVLPELGRLIDALGTVQARYAETPKIGRTHLMDAVPLFFGDEVSGWRAQCAAARDALERAGAGALEVPLGGTAVGTGLNAPPEYAERTVTALGAALGCAFRVAPNRFAAMGAHDALVRVSGALRDLAVALHAIASNVRLLASGPASGLAELKLPANEPGSSIMPGKVNPTQCEALTMVCARVIGNDATVAFAGAQGHLQLNVYKPVIASALLESLELLGDGMRCFREYCVAGMEANVHRMREYLEASVMAVTALTPEIGYQRAAEIAKLAYESGRPLRDILREATDLGEARLAELLDFDAMCRGETPT